MKYKKLYISLAVILIIVVIVAFQFKKNAVPGLYKYKVTNDNLVIKLHSTGDLEAENNIDIRLPDGLQRIHLYKIKISDIVPEGTIVDSGDYIASLDKGELTSKLNDIETEYQKINNAYLQAIIDSTIKLGNAREDLINTKVEQEEKQLESEQSKYETPASKRKLELELSKLKRKYKRDKKNYLLQVKQSESAVKNAFLQLKKQEDWIKRIQDIQDKFTIVSPGKGMVLYKRERNGKRRKANSEISPWDPVVAQLPDMSKLICRTWINELDISKISVGNNAIIAADAFPDKTYKGEVINIANVGETRNGSTIKSFEVIVRLNETDSLLKPSMTASVTITAKTLANVILIPLEALFFEDEKPVVYKMDYPTASKRGINFAQKTIKHSKPRGIKPTMWEFNSPELVKQEVQLGASNEDFIVVEKGLQEDNIILTIKPEDSDNLEIVNIYADN